MTLYLSNQQPLTLSKQLGAGGEGTVYALPNNPDAVAKIYHQAPTVRKQAKLTAMALGCDAELEKIALWPKALVYDAHQQVLGFLMPRLPASSLAIHHLYNPSQRKKDFPQADYAFLVHAARNVAAAFEVLHRHGHCIGDVNQGNVVIAPDATVKLIDCDSFQIQTEQSVFVCEVGVAHFTPPELHGQPFDQVTKTPAHDNFGLAILIFHLLMMGRHPFAGVYLGEGEMTIEKAITEFRYAYSQQSHQTHMRPPPKAPSIDWLPQDIKQLFEEAFDADVERPSAETWLVALERFEKELTSCEYVNKHTYYKELGSCVWCDFSDIYNVEFFLQGLPTHLQRKKSRERFAKNVSIIKNKLLSIKPINIVNQLPDYSFDDFPKSENRLVSIVVFLSVIYLILVNTVFGIFDSLLIISFIGFIIRIFNLKYYFPNIEFRRPSIPRSFWVIYIGFSNIFGFSNGFVFSVIAWHLIKYLLIFMQVKKEVYWPLDLWLVNSKYFQIKNDYWLKVKEINVFRDKWSQHLFEGQKLLNTKEQALLWCDEYQYLAATNNNDDASQRLEDLSLVLPKLPQQIVQDIENYEIDNQTMILDWKRLNQEKLSFGDIYNYKGKTLLPPEPSKNWTYKPYSIYGFVFMPLVIFAFISSFSNIHKKQLLNNENDLSKKGVLNEIKQPKRDSVQIAIDVNESSKSNTQVYPLEVEERFLMEDGSYQIGRKLSYTSNSASSVVEKFLTDKNKGVYKTGAKLRYTSTSPSVMQMLFAVDNGLYKSGSTLHVISVYRGRYPEGILNSYGSHPNGRIDVTVKNNPNTSSIVLFLASREPVNWNINPQNGVKIKKIMLSSFENRSKVIGVDNVQVVITSPFPHPYEQQQIPTLDDLAENIKNAIGAKSFTAQGGYDGVKFETY